MNRGLSDSDVASGVKIIFVVGIVIVATGLLYLLHHFSVKDTTRHIVETIKINAEGNRGIAEATNKSLPVANSTTNVNVEGYTQGSLADAQMIDEKTNVRQLPGRIA